MRLRKLASAMSGVEKRTERGDHVVFSQDGKTLRFRFHNDGGIDGLVFRVGCSNRIAISGEIEGRALRPNDVYIGADGRHPDRVPFTIARRVTPSRSPA